MREEKKADRLKPRNQPGRVGRVMRGLALGLAALVWCWEAGAQPGLIPPATTTYTRTLLKASTSAAACSILGITTNLSSLTTTGAISAASMTVTDMYIGTGYITNGVFTGTASFDAITFTNMYTGVTNGSYLTTDANSKLVLKTVAQAKVLLGIQSGTCTVAADGTVTNTFATAYSTAPNVVVTPLATANYGTNYLVSVSTTNFIYHGTATVVNHWIAVGAP